MIAKWIQVSPMIIVEDQTGKRRIVLPQEVIFRDAGALGFKWATNQSGFRKYFHNNFALGVKNGALIPSVVLKQAFETHAADPNVGVVSRDVKNQFHQFNRAMLMRCLEQNFGVGFETIVVFCVVFGYSHYGCDQTV